VDPAVVKELREQVRFAMAIVAMRDEKYREALSAFESIYKPEAAFYSGQVWRNIVQCCLLKDFLYCVLISMILVLQTHGIITIMIMIHVYSILNVHKKLHIFNQTVFKSPIQLNSVLS